MLAKHVIIQNMFKPEILAPGGSFNSSIHAFEAGADAVYIGMSAFSARKGAKNFTLEELRRLTAYARKKNRKIFTAINTVLKNDELNDVIQLLHNLSLIAVDAVILQDPGLAYIIKKEFPELEIHASTQMAVHNSRGIAFLKNEGFTRIILARELSLKEIGKLREEHKDVELEVFIHGAMCYSFSGICLASGTLLNRSGNRGECGQICRTWFESSQGNRYQFSANDLKAGKLVKDLQEIGIDSLKIEGRLKSPEYVSHTVSYYRSLIDGSDRKTSEKEERLSSLSFSRDQTTAFFNDPKGINLINNQYASHTGVIAGKVISSDNRSFSLKCETDLSDRDGLLIISKGEKEQFALKSDGNKNHYKSGETVKILYKGKIKEGTSVHKISGHDLQLKEYNEKSWKPWKTPIDIEVQLTPNDFKIKSKIFGETVEISQNVTVENSSSGKDISEILLQNMSRSGLSYYAISELNLINKTGVDNTGLFIPLSEIKQLKKNFYRKLEKFSIEIIEKRTTAILSLIKEDLNSFESEHFPDLHIPQRKEMIPAGNEIPFYSGQKYNSRDKLFLPLNPLLFHIKDFDALEKDIDDLLSNPKTTVILGLNNVSHFHFVERYREEKRILFFTDYCTYMANDACRLFYLERIPRLLFSYYWIEDHKGNPGAMKRIERDFSPHLFVSRICYKRHNGLGSCQNCSRDLTYELKQRDKNFTVIVKNCITWLFQKG